MFRIRGGLWMAGGGAGKDRIVARIGVTVGARSPSSCMGPTINRETSVIENGSTPGGSRMTVATCFRKCGSRVARISCCIVLLRMTGIAGRRGAGIDAPNMTIGARYGCMGSG
jgi:hypothetical protein